ncbi:cell adhesion molecule Dscam2-like [Eriocheir sinensis]|uniref:cell adhesion molecule Dscam2-like n=1 Tax=Eriocheir sinensis TaxID=95602 RepID=UPI0021C67CCE|nr:cell adhesion molecule Dscam2-like [Eriocheir sinensis]
MTGNTAVLQCVVPSYLREFVSVTSWQLEDSRHVYPSLHGDGKYHMTEAGDLHVLDVTPADGLSRFRCRALHHLTGKSQVSASPARIIVTEAQGAVAPRMRESGGRVVVESGSSVTLPCVAQAHPPPSYSWFRGSDAVGSGDVGGGVWVVGGSLVLERADTSHAGQYSCVANNTAGQARMPVHLMVVVPLSVQVTPRQVQVDAGGRLELKCHVSGSPVEAVTWLKDGAEVRAEGRVSLRPRDTLRVAPVVSSDAGMYQCVATHAHHYAHAHAHVTLGAAPPQLLYRFIEQTLQPGPAVSLKCIAAGTPTPHITWTLDGFPLPHSHRLVKGQYVSAEGDVISHVNISSVHVADGGAYTCTAANSAGEAAHSARLNVYGPPQVRPMGQQTAVAGRTFVVACPASGHPIHTITWTKDGSPLPRSYRQRVLANGTLVIQEVTRGADDGRYACTAASRSGRADTQTLQLRVLVPPSLAQLTFPKNTRAGMQIRATCLVQEGDQPVRYAWTKDGRPLDARLGVRTSQLDAFTSILVIERAAAEHSGNYTCTASNAAAASATTARLTVNVPPTWVVEPSSSSVALGGSLALHCLARGFPDPVTTWRRQAASGEFVGVVEGVGSGDTSIVQWKNGTLWIGRSARGHEGRYLCEAGNGVPPGLSKLVDITVNEPPWFRATEQRQEVRVGGAATLTCHAHGDALLTLAWSRDAVSLPPLPRYQVSSREEPEQGGTVSQLVVTDARLEDSGAFTCTASNSHGVRTSHLHLLVQDVPGPPSGVEVAEVGPQHLAVTWTSPQDSNAPITAYIVTVEPQSSAAGSGGAREERVGGQERRVVVGGLTPATQYSLRVAAENHVGRGRSSPPVIASTEEQPPSAPPRSVTVMAVSSSALRVTWEPPQQNTTHGTLLGYHLGHKLGSDAEDTYNFTRVGGVGSLGVTSARVPGLKPHTRYSVVLRAFNSKGAGPTSPPALATTLEDKPSAPPGRVRCDGVSSSSLVVTWTPPPPSHRNGVVTSYRVAFWKTAATEDGSEEAAMMSKGLRAQLDNLRPWTNYSVSVAASTRAGQGVASEALVCTTHQDVPEAPARIKAVASGPRAAVVSWAPPAHPHGRLIRYTVYWKAAGGGSGGGGGEISRRVDPELTHLTLHDLSHVAHKVWVTAATKKGEGPSSSVVLVKPSHSVGAGVWSVGGNVTAAWREDVSLPCGAVGAPEPSLEWAHDGAPLHSGQQRASVQRDGTLSLSDLQRNDGGRYTCTATNHHGRDSAVYHLTVLVPPSPPSLHVIETTTSSVRVQWNVEDTGGATLQGSSLHYRVVESKKPEKSRVAESKKPEKSRVVESKKPEKSRVVESKKPKRVE